MGTDHCAIKKKVSPDYLVGYISIGSSDLLCQGWNRPDSAFTFEFIPVGKAGSGQIFVINAKWTFEPSRIGLLGKPASDYPTIDLPI